MDPLLKQKINRLAKSAECKGSLSGEWNVVMENYKLKAETGSRKDAEVRGVCKVSGAPVTIQKVSFFGSPVHLRKIIHELTVLRKLSDIKMPGLPIRRILDIIVPHNFMEV